ncbi:YggT family protein [Paraglaciecola sp. L3A3]|uniref:YggT family protein n=1 Tax=Paraglaciecola sp. L3A3 TaxID=2686358 RepID=UPI00131AF8C2|nr:YggT family protein [Paraglaciecola sp. L3A3]
MSSVQFLISTVFDLYLMVVLLRLWLQFARADFYNPFSQFVVKATHPIVAPMRRILPSIGRLDTATFVLALLVAALKLVILNVVVNGVGINPISLVIISFIIVIKEAFTVVMYTLILRAVMSWISQGRSPMELVLNQLTEPMLAPIRRRLPEMGGLDLSVMVVILVLLFLQKLLGDIFGIF